MTGYFTAKKGSIDTVGLSFVSHQETRDNKYISRLNTYDQVSK